MEEQEYYEQLVKRYLDNTATEKELEVFFKLLDEGTLKPEFERQADVEYYKLLDERHHALKKTNRIVQWLPYAAAAIVLIAIGLGTYFYLANYTGPNNQHITINDVDPGGNRATLTLASGEKILLDSVSNGLLAEDSGIKITKTDDGQIVYETLSPFGGGSVRSSDGKGEEKKISYNTIQTPRGGQYKIILPDSSCVWLNAASSLKYPTRFSGAERRVELSGEAYFEVAKAKAPFVVATETQTVQVLGTHFNINAYGDEPVVSTTLLEGSVSVASLGNSPQQVTLMPNQQARLTDRGFNIIEVDVGQAIAWKNGIIRFKDADMRSILRQASRWYDIDIEYRGEITNETFTGGISKSSNLSVLLRILKFSDVEFTLEHVPQGKKLIVGKK